MCPTDCCSSDELKCEKFLIELLSDSSVISQKVLEVSESPENAEDLARNFVAKLLESASYSSLVENGKEDISPKLPVGDLGFKNNLKYLCINLGKDFQRRSKRRTVKEFVSQCLSYSVPAYVPTVLLILCIASYKPMPDEVCFAKIGCLSLDEPWTERPLVFNFVPQSPVTINTSFIVHSREYPDGYQFSAMESNPDVSDIDWSRNMHILVHGFTDNATDSWISRLSKAYVEKEDVIILAVDWSTGADMYYPQSVANARVVAAQVTLFLDYLTEKCGEEVGEIHIVGHSLGAHIAGYIGKRSQKIKRITGLDPAAPLFEGFHKDIGLHMSDAEEVVVFHTNSAPVGFGIRDPMGHIDIYVNDGKDQFGCIAMLDLLLSPPTIERIQGMRDNIACSHRRAYEIFSEALLSAHPLTAYPCHSYATDERDLCVSVCEPGDKCHRIGKDGIKIDGHKIFYLPTGDSHPYCVTHAKVRGTLCPKQPPIFSAKIFGGFKPFIKSMYNGLLNSNQNIESLVKVKCGALYEPNVKLQLEAHTSDAFLHPQAVCFSALEVTYQDSHNDMIRLVKENVVLDDGQCTELEFQNNQFSLFSYRDSFLDYLHKMKMNVVLPLYETLELDSLFKLIPKSS